MDPFAIQLRGVGKRYWKLEDRSQALRALLPFTRDRRSEFWAVQDIDLSIAPGETVGVVGRNGAGKTTLLRMLAGVTRPSRGTLDVIGRVAPLISVGVGFHPEMSGRENVFVNGMLLGLTKEQIQQRFDAIVDFAEMDEFVDTPVKFYSSGMFMRLGFSVAVHADPQVLLVDEVLAVGDLAFQLKCFERMRDIQRSGTTIVIVSHSMHAIRLLCPRAVVVRKGRIEFDGEVEQAIAHHHELLSLDASDDRTVRFDGRAVTVGGASIVERRLVDGNGAPIEAPRPGSRSRLVTTVRFDRAVESPHVVFTVTSQDGTLAYAMRTALGQRHRSYGPGDVATVDIDFDARLAGGTYRLTTTITSTDGREVYEPDGRGLLLYVTPPLGSQGIADLDAEVRVDGTVLTDHPPVSLSDGRAVLGA